MMNEIQVRGLLDSQVKHLEEAKREMRDTAAALILANNVADYEIAVRSRVAHDEATSNVMWHNAVIAILKEVLR
jgi:hypothetical protein